MVPWLALSDQALIFPNQRTFERPAEQEECMREWIKKRTGLAPDFEIVWYPGAAHCCTHSSRYSGPEYSGAAHSSPYGHIYSGATYPGAA